MEPGNINHTFSLYSANRLFHSPQTTTPSQNGAPAHHPLQEDPLISNAHLDEFLSDAGDAGDPMAEVPLDELGIIQSPFPPPPHHLDNATVFESNAQSISTPDSFHEIFGAQELNLDNQSGIPLLSNASQATLENLNASEFPQGVSSQEMTLSNPIDTRHPKRKHDQAATNSVASNHKRRPPVPLPRLSDYLRKKSVRISKFSGAALVFIKYLHKSKNLTDRLELLCPIENVTAQGLEEFVACGMAMIIEHPRLTNWFVRACMLRSKNYRFLLLNSDTPREVVAALQYGVPGFRVLLKNFRYESFPSLTYHEFLRRISPYNEQLDTIDINPPL